MALWTRKREEPLGPGTIDPDGTETVHLDGDENAWWAQQEVKAVWRPKEPPAAPAPKRDILAEHFGPDWRTSFGFTPADEDQRRAQAEREQKALDEQDPYAVLDIDPDATWDEIIAAHRYQARVHHPDLLFGQSEEEKAESEARIRVINTAYKELRIRRGM